MDALFIFYISRGSVEITCYLYVICNQNRYSKYAFTKYAIYVKIIYYFEIYGGYGR